MSPEALCPTSINDAFVTNYSETLKSISSENIIEIVGGYTTESDFTEELINGENAFYEYHGDDDRIIKRNAKLWEINGVFYNKSEIQSMCEPVS